MRETFFANFAIAFEAVLANRVRSFLTALGIIFGVAAVIAMMAIGNGAQQEILEQIKLVGVNNIVIEPVVEQSEESISEDSEGGQDGEQKPQFSPGLSLLDVESIEKVVPGLATVSPEVILETYVINNGLRRSAKLVGVTPSYFDVSKLPLGEGRMFNEDQVSKGLPVCIIGSGIKAKFFPQEDPVGKVLKCGPHWLKVVGVLQERRVSQKSIENLGIRDYNMDVYTPIQTMLIRYRNRAKVTEGMLGGGGGGRGRMIIIGGEEEEEPSAETKNYHQIDRLVVQVDNSETLSNTAEVVSRMLERRHYGVVDYQITIPILLLEQQQRTNDIFNYVLAAIAAISLLVGGIGIMNIMLASVLERIKEIGLRLAIGAKKQDIVMQFVLESIMISISGGLVGVILGISLAYIVSEVAEIPTVISFLSIIVSFGVAALVGLFFGIFPAQRAAKQDPISSLRYE